MFSWLRNFGRITLLTVLMVVVGLLMGMLAAEHTAPVEPLSECGPCWYTPHWKHLDRYQGIRGA